MIPQWSRDRGEVAIGLFEGRILICGLLKRVAGEGEEAGEDVSDQGWVAGRGVEELRGCGYGPAVGRVAVLLL